MCKSKDSLSLYHTMIHRQSKMLYCFRLSTKICTLGTIRVRDLKKNKNLVGNTRGMLTFNKMMWLRREGKHLIYMRWRETKHKWAHIGAGNPTTQ